MATPRLGLVVEDKPTELSCTCMFPEYSHCSSICFNTSRSSLLKAGAPVLNKAVVPVVLKLC